MVGTVFEKLSRYCVLPIFEHLLVFLFLSCVIILFLVQLIVSLICERLLRLHSKKKTKNGFRIFGRCCQRCRLVVSKREREREQHHRASSSSSSSYQSVRHPNEHHHASSFFCADDDAAFSVVLRRRRPGARGALGRREQRAELGGRGRDDDAAKKRGFLPREEDKNGVKIRRGDAAVSRVFRRKDHRSLFAV